MENNQATLREPIESIRAVLQWITENPKANASITYSPEYGWRMTAFMSEEEVTYGGE